MKTKICYVVSAVLLLVAVVFFSQGMNKKDKYVNSESYFVKSVNAYVGGDAYNYIINGTYFSGYMAIAAGALISSAVLFGAGCLVDSQEKTTLAIEQGLDSEEKA